MATGPFPLFLGALFVIVFYAYGPFLLRLRALSFRYCFMPCIVDLAHDMLSLAIPKYSLTFGAIQIPLFRTGSLPMNNSGPGNKGY